MQCREPLTELRAAGEVAELRARIEAANRRELRRLDECLTRAKQLQMAELRPLFPALEVPRRCR